MSDVQALLARQTEWQKARRALSWPEKMRLAAAVRESVLALRTAPTREQAEGPRRER